VALPRRRLTHWTMTLICYHVHEVTETPNSSELFCQQPQYPCPLAAFHANQPTPTAPTAPSGRRSASLASCIDKNFVYISPICPETRCGRIFMKFCMRGHLADVINYAKFYINRVMGFDSVWVIFLAFPACERCVAVQSSI